jgi:poly-beta-1,6-N-acetyl-D-glucosamine synthase
MPLPNYVLITPARNEGEFIELIIRSVVSQTVKPLRWVIVSDGSTDGMEDIVKRYLADNPWIELLRMPNRRERDFASKVHAFNAGYTRVAELKYEVIGNLDADVSFASDYFEFLMKAFAANPRLGVAGTAFIEDGLQYDYRFTNIEHVSGQCQLFRRACFENIGGYTPRKLGGIDVVAVTTARMNGWHTKTFPEKTFVHHRKMSTAMHGSVMVPLRGGQKDYTLGNHPVWELCRCIYQATRPPLVIGGALRLAGFMWALTSRTEKQVPAELVRFLRREQMYRLRKFLTWS